MLCAYYDKSCNSRELFEGLDIAKEDSFEKYLNKYDVIYLDITLFISKTPDMYDTEKKETFIPNEEVKQEFIRAITASKHTEIAKLIDNSDNLIKQTLNMNEKAKN